MTLAGADVKNFAGKIEDVISAPDGKLAKMKKMIVSPMTKRKNVSCFYGVSLTELMLQSPGAPVPTALAHMIHFISQHGLDEEGIFRVSGSAKTVEKVRATVDKCNSGEVDLDEFAGEVSAVAGALKLFFRELPEPLIPAYLQDMFVRSQDGCEDNLVQCDEGAVNKHVQELQKLVAILPTPNLSVLKYLCSFLVTVSEHNATNKMTAHSLGIVFGPNLFRCKGEGMEGLKEQTCTNFIVERFIQFYEAVFQASPESSSYHSYGNQRTAKAKQVSSPPSKPKPYRQYLAEKVDVPAGESESSQHANQPPDLSVEEEQYMAQHSPSNSKPALPKSKHASLPRPPPKEHVKISIEDDKKDTNQGKADLSPSMANRRQQIVVEDDLRSSSPWSPNSSTLTTPVPPNALTPNATRNLEAIIGDTVEEQLFGCKDVDGHKDQSEPESHRRSRPLPGTVGSVIGQFERKQDQVEISSPNVEQRPARQMGRIPIPSVYLKGPNARDAYDGNNGDDTVREEGVFSGNHSSDAADRGVMRTTAQVTSDFKTNLNNLMRQPVATKDGELGRTDSLANDESVTLSGFKAQSIRRENSTGSESAVQIMTNTGLHVRKSRFHYDPERGHLPGQASIDAEGEDAIDGRVAAERKRWLQSLDDFSAVTDNVLTLSSLTKRRASAPGNRRPPSRFQRRRRNSLPAMHLASWQRKCPLESHQAKSPPEPCEDKCLVESGPEPAPKPVPEPSRFRMVLAAPTGQTRRSLLLLSGNSDGVTASTSNNMVSPVYQLEEPQDDVRSLQNSEQEKGEAVKESPQDKVANLPATSHVQSSEKKRYLPQVPVVPSDDTQDVAHADYRDPPREVWRSQSGSVTDGPNPDDTMVVETLVSRPVAPVPDEVAVVTTPPEYDETDSNLSVPSPEAYQGMDVAEIAVHVNALKQRVKLFDVQFFQQYGRKPSGHDRDPIRTVLSSMHAAKKRVQALREDVRRQSMSGTEHEPATLVSSSNNHVAAARSYSSPSEKIPSAFETQQHLPDQLASTYPLPSARNNVLTKERNEGPLEHLQVIVNNVMEKLESKRVSANRPSAIEEMSFQEMTDEKHSVQKCLLQFEAQHGRPKSAEEKSIVRPLYERYRLLKKYLQQTEKGSSVVDAGAGTNDFTLSRSLQLDESLHAPREWRKDSVFSDTEKTPLSSRSGSPHLSVSLLGDSCRVSQPSLSTSSSWTESATSNIASWAQSLRSAPTATLLEEQQKISQEKLDIRKKLKVFEDNFTASTGRKVNKVERGDMSSMYESYKQCKARLRVLEALLSKRDASQTV